MTVENNKNVFVILLGVSGVGKSSIIHAILARENRYQYVKPYMTRPLRSGEQDKISVTGDVFKSMEASGEFIVVNEHFGFKYGTPRKTILDAFTSGSIPILDYQLASIDNLVDPAYTLLKIYIQPDSINEWEKRLTTSGQYNKDRFILGKNELRNIMSADNIHSVDHVVVNKDGQLDEAVEEIIKHTTKAIQ